MIPTRDTAEIGRSRYLDEVCGLLWPGGDSAVTRELIVLPRRSRPRLLVPSERRPAATALRSYGEPGSRAARWGSRGLALLTRYGGSRMLLRDRVVVEAAPGGGIEAYLAEQLGREVRIGLYLSAPRANRKPVLQLLSPGGELLGVAKLGAGAVPARLVVGEHRALQTVAAHRPEGVVAPEVFSFGHWHGMPVLLLGPLPVSERRVGLTPGQLNRAIARVAEIGGIDRGPLAAGGYSEQLARKLGQLPAGDERALLERSLADLLERYAAASLRLGSWHGDWTPWNMASTRHGLLLWDWERFAGGVPVGFDALHHRLQSAMVPGRDVPGEAARQLWRDAGVTLGPFVSGIDEARATALLYLIELAARQLGDGQAAAGARLGAVGEWLLPAIAEGVQRS